MTDENDRQGARGGFLRLVLYPFRGYRFVTFIIAAAIVFGAGRLADKVLANLKGSFLGGSFALGMGLMYAVIAICLYGYLSLYVMSVISRVAVNDDKELPEWPDIRAWSEAIQGAFLFGGSVVVSFMPLIIYSLASDGSATWHWVFASVGFVYCPMAVLSVAIHDDLAGANPIIVVGSIVTTLPSYSCVLWIVPSVWALYRYVQNDLLMCAVAAIGITYCLMIGACLLGMLYRQNADKLQWFPEEPTK